MLKESLQFLADELNKYLVQKLGASQDDERVVLGNVAKAYDNAQPLLGEMPIANKAILSLVNIEEDKVAKQQENFVRTDTNVRYKNPPVLLNVYILFSVNKNVYADSLVWLSYIVQFFQHQNSFTPLTHPALNSKIKKLMVDLYTLNFEQVNHLWSTLGGKYLPSAMYKIRQLTIDEDLVISEGSFIKEIVLQEKLKLAVTE
jgi:hypothetical protein